jgi:hypothetical protein
MHCLPSEPQIDLALKEIQVGKPNLDERQLAR